MKCFSISTSSGRRALRCLWWLMTTAILVTVPFMFWVWMRNGWKYELLAWIISGLFVLLATPMTVYQVAMHYENYTKPVYQRRIIRILWMVPMYGLCSWFALRFRDAEMYLDTVREFYEAFVIYNFYMFLITFLEEAFGSANSSSFGSLPKYLEETRGEVPHIFPLNKIFKPVVRPAGAKEHPFFRKCKNGVMAYVIWRPVSACLAFYFSSKGMYFSNHQPWRPDRFYIWLALSNSSAQIVLLILVQFEVLKPSDLAPHRAEGEQPSKAELAGALNNVLICCEMFLAALAHANAFPAKEYYPPEPLTPASQRGVMRNMWDMFNVWDVFKDTTDFGGDMVVLGGEAIRDTTVAAVNIGVRGTRNVASSLPVLKNFAWSNRTTERQDTPLLSQNHTTRTPSPDAHGAALRPMSREANFGVYDSLSPLDASSSDPTGLE
ncbi:transmembrane protein 184C-like isoform X2 [Convolutriloba macropyga]|uniref:transmembrane protein 184C-like isoform X2 n=1 Tax=Convolutriloba macropyga TaxID=536237 RepID=UPI003F5276E7